MPADYWNQFLHVQEENIRSPPYNPNTHNSDGTPKTPQGVTGKKREVIAMTFLAYSYVTAQRIDRNACPHTRQRSFRILEMLSGLRWCSGLTTCLLLLRSLGSNPRPGGTSFVRLVTWVWFCLRRRFLSGPAGFVPQGKFFGWMLSKRPWHKCASDYINLENRIFSSDF